MRSVAQNQPTPPQFAPRPVDFPQNVGATPAQTSSVDSEAEAKSVTIVINDNGEINYDEKTLQSIIGKSKV